MSQGDSLDKVCVKRRFLTAVLPREVTADWKLYGNSISCGFSPSLSTGET